MTWSWHMPTDSIWETNLQCDRQRELELNVLHHNLYHPCVNVLTYLNLSAETACCTASSVLAASACFSAETSVEWSERCWLSLRLGGGEGARSSQKDYFTI